MLDIFGIIITVVVTTLIEKLLDLLKQLFFLIKAKIIKMVNKYKKQKVDIVENIEMTEYREYVYKESPSPKASCSFKEKSADFEKAVLVFENYKKYITLILECDYEDETLKKSRKEILCYVEDDKIKKILEHLNKTIDEYFILFERQHWFTPRLKDRVSEKFNDVLPKLEDYFQFQNVFQSTITQAAAKVGLKNYDVCSGSDTKEYLQDFKKFEDL